MKKSSSVFVLFIFTLLISCKHDIPVLPPDGSDGVCFENDILPIFQSNCAKSGCHDAASREEGYRLDTYANIIAKGIRPGNANNSEIYEVLLEDNPDKVMPQPPNAPLTAAQKTLIATWINEGARNTTNCATTCDSSNFTYNGAVKPILETHCFGCHSETAADGGFIPLDNYAAVKDQVNFNTLYPSIAHTGSNPMPKNSSKLSDCKIAQVRKWIESGAPNN